MNYMVRPLTDEDVPFMWDMLYESMYVPVGQEPFSRDILQEPSIAKYAEHWGRPGDIGWVAVTEEGERMGTITARIFPENNHGYGFVGADIPEMGMALHSAYRGQGVGTALMQALFDELHRSGYTRVSLSVDPNNTAAVKLYRRFGFEEVGTVDTSVTMVAEVRPQGATD